MGGGGGSGGWETRPPVSEFSGSAPADPFLDVFRFVLHNISFVMSPDLLSEVYFDLGTLYARRKI